MANSLFFWQPTAQASSHRLCADSSQEISCSKQQAASKQPGCALTPLDISRGDFVSERMSSGLATLLLLACCGVASAFLGPAPFRRFRRSAPPTATPPLTIAMSARNVKIRSVTAFVTIPRGACAHADSLRAALSPAAANNAVMRQRLETAGFEVQTTRIASNSFEDYLSLADATALAGELDTLGAVLAELEICFFNLGKATSLEAIDAIPDLLQALPTASASCDLLPTRKLADLSERRARRVAAACLRIAAETAGGSGNFRS